MERLFKRGAYLNDYGNEFIDFCSFVKFCSFNKCFDRIKHYLFTVGKAFKS